MEENENAKEIKETKKTNTKVPSANKDKTIILVIVIAVLFIAFGLFGLYYYRTNMQAVVTFDGGRVSKTDYAAYYKLFSQYLSYYGYPEDQIGNQIAQKAGLDKVLLTKAKAAGITLTADEKKSVDSELTADQLKQFSQRGIAEGQIKQLYYNDKIINKYIDKLKNEVSNDDMLAYLKQTYGNDADLNEYVTREILFKTSTTDSTTGQSTNMSDADKAKQKQKAQDVLNKVLNGEDFATLAKSNSEDTGTKDNGGEYKMYMDSSTDQSYSDAVKKMKVGEVYPELVESQYGYHIIKLEAINANGRTNSSTDRENYVESNLSKYSDDAHMKVNTKVLNATIKALTGKDPSVSNNNTTTKNNSTVENSTTSTNNTATETNNIAQ